MTSCVATVKRSRAESRTKGSDLHSNHSWGIFQEVEQRLLKRQKTLEREFKTSHCRAMPMKNLALDSNSWEKTVAEDVASKIEGGG